MTAGPWLLDAMAAHVARAFYWYPADPLAAYREQVLRECLL